MTKLFILRHGQTESNVRGTYLGYTDIPLNETGQHQAKELGKRLSTVCFDAVYTSPQQRAIETAQQVISQQKSPPVMKMNDGLRERDFGIFDDLTHEEIQKKYPKELSCWLEDWLEYQIPKGESAREVQNRVGDTLDKIIAENKGRTVAVVTHLGVLRHAIAYLLKLDIADAWHFTAKNCSVCKLYIDDNQFTVLTALNA